MKIKICFVIFLISLILINCKKDSSGNNNPEEKPDTNYAPAAPVNPNPSDGAVDVNTKTFSWTASTDPDDDIITYDLYADTVAVPKLVVTNLTKPEYNISKMYVGAKYYWKVVAKDNHNNSTSGELWSFTTRLTCTDYEGNRYKTIKIGNQNWMAENLKSKQTITSDLTADIDYKIYNNKFGLLYSYTATMDGSLSSNKIPSEVRGLCPIGWHLPSDLEWEMLIDYLGSDSVAGGKLKAIGSTAIADSLWKQPNGNATNESGFSALPGGMYNVNSHYVNVGVHDITRFWTSTANVVLIDNKPTELGHYIELNYLDGTVKKGTCSDGDQYSIRCVKN
jgi:uncharacterized protein (TIGR02145 family)